MISFLTAGLLLGVICLDVVSDGGADRSGISEATEAVQGCLTRVAKAGGGEVVFPPGIYRISSLSVGANTHVKLAGGAQTACCGYDRAIQDSAADPAHSAIIRPTGKGYCGIFFYNLVPPDWMTNGASRISVSGGVFECEGRAKVSAIVCAKGVVLENMVVKDLPDHAFQIGGCSDVVITNCLFAGYRYKPGLRSLTGETIQLETTSPLAIWASNPTHSPILCPEGDYRPNTNVTIANCWFGPSENNGPHIVPIGHHCAQRSCDGLQILGNVFVDPWCAALRIANWVNVTVSGNRFVATRPCADLSHESAFVSVIGGKTLKPGERGIGFSGNSFEMADGVNYPVLWVSSERFDEIVRHPIPLPR